MAELYIPLEDAAGFEQISYKGFASRLSRNPSDYKTQQIPSDNGGKARVLVALSSLSTQGRKRHRAAQKIDAAKPVIDAYADEEVPWYVDADLNWFIEKQNTPYYQAVELASQIRDFVEYEDGDRTAHAENYAEKLGISVRTLYRNTEKYLEASAWALKMEQDEGYNYDYYMVLALCRKPRETHTFPSLTPEQRAIIENTWFDKVFASNLGSVEMLYTVFEKEANERDWDKYPSIKTVGRYINFLMKIKAAGSAHYLQANGLRAWKNEKMIKGKRDTTSLAVMELFQGDAHTFDCWVEYTHSNGKVVAIRPQLVGFIDTRSRTIHGDVMCEHSNSQVLKESIVKASYASLGGVECGVVKSLLIDNGKDFTSKTNTGQNRKERQLDFDSETKGFYRSIGIQDWTRSLPHQPWSKAQIERLFGTVCTMFSKWMDSYVGTLTGSRTYAKREKDVPRMLERGELLTMEEFFGHWEHWKNEVYHKREHSSLKKDGELYTTPESLFVNAENRYFKAPPVREYAAVLLMKSHSALVRNQGITKFNTIYTDYALADYVDQRVNIKWDMDDVTKLYVFNQHTGEKICEAYSAELLQFAPGVSQAALEKHLRNQKRQLKDTREEAAEYTTPFEVREGATALVTGGLDLTIGKDSNKVVTLPQDKEFRSELLAGSTLAPKQKKSKGGNEFLNKKADEALEKIRALG